MQLSYHLATSLSTIFHQINSFHNDFNKIIFHNVIPSFLQLKGLMCKLKLKLKTSFLKKKKEKGKKIGPSLHYLSLELHRAHIVLTARPSSGHRCISGITTQMVKHLQRDREHWLCEVILFYKDP